MNTKNSKRRMGRLFWLLPVILQSFAQPPVAALAEDGAAQRWLRRFAHVEPCSSSEGICTGSIGDLPRFEVRVRRVGKQLVRVALPFAPGAMPDRMGLQVANGDRAMEADLRPLTWHPGEPRSVRRGLVTFSTTFDTLEPRNFRLQLTGAREAPETSFSHDGNLWSIEFHGLTLKIGSAEVRVTCRDGHAWKARLLCPDLSPDSWTPAEDKDGASSARGLPEIVEAGRHYLWVRLLVYDTRWPRIVEVRADALGTVSVQAHLQRLDAGDATAPEFGWELDGLAMHPFEPHQFAEGSDCTLRTADGAWTASFPAAPGTRCGGVAMAALDKARTAASGLHVRYLRCRAADHVPMQQTSWRRASFVIGPTAHTPLSPLLEPRLDVTVAAEEYDTVYGMGLPPDLSLWPVLDDLRRVTHELIRRSACVGDDDGNITSFSRGRRHGVPFGMNRLNHCPALFEEAWRSGDRTLRDLAVRWCCNFHDLTIWWGDTDEVGGTRYNNVNAMGLPDHQDDHQFMWRSNSAVHFCTKGVDSLLMAYEETGDPRMAATLRAQVAYAKRFVHANQGECRNIGDVADFLRLHRTTGIDEYRQNALRLFRELRGKLSAGDLFSQGGQPILQDGPFIDDDQHGTEAPYAKPYILGYALAGLPQLLRLAPDEEKLHDVVRAVADFMAHSQDPVGGWRYPHPASSRVIIGQAMEHAGQLARAAAVLESRGEPIERLLDAIERTLQARVLGYRRSGTILAGLGGWEEATGAIPAGKTLHDQYAMPADRDPTRDTTEGAVQLGGSPPEGLVYLPEVMQFYLAHRPAERLFLASAPLQAVLDRVEDCRLRLIPRQQGSFLRIERPEDPTIGFTLWAPEWVTLPKLGYSKTELGGMAIDWQSDPGTGTTWYALDRPEATFTATFVPHGDYVECTYTAWPKGGFQPQGRLGVGPCAQMKEGIFEGDETDLMARLWFLSGGQWKSIGSCASKNPRNVLHLLGEPSPEMTGPMAESGWKTIQSPRPDTPLIACTSPDGRWVAATAAEFSTSLCNNAGQSHRCLHSQGSVPLRRDGPTTLRVQVYLLQGGLRTLESRYAADVKRWAHTPPAPSCAEMRTDTYGLRQRQPTFSDARVRRMDFPLARRSVPATRVPPATPSRRDLARRVILDSLSTPPPRAPFAPRVLAVEDRGAYEARKLALNINGDCRIKAYLLVPKTAGPHPGILALHDHGAHFSIGKEKVVRPFGEPEAVLQDARDWVNQCYGGHWIGDRLAARGYVVLAIDVLFWGDRGRYEGVEYAEQQALAANMLQLGYTWAGYNAWDDIRSAQFLQGHREVDPARIGCVGLSMGANRAWHLAAATDIIQAAAAICWMCDTPTLTQAGNNQTTGQSAFSMLHPGLRNALDYADVAAIASPRPMLFFNGTQDGLFPVPGVEAAYRTLRDAWRQRDAADRLLCKLWDVPHVFNEPMQQKAFDWLDHYLK